MSIEAVLVRIAQIDPGLVPRPPAPAPPGPVVSEGFGAMLERSGATLPTAAVAPPQITAGDRMLAAARAEVGVAEAPPGSNDAPRIAEYRTATAGSGVGPWCAYFTSWLAKGAGVPIGDQGQGYGLVDDVAAWATRTGRMQPDAKAGDLIVWDEHIGIVESVDPDGSINTIEGNSGDAVTRRSYGPDGGGAVGYVRL